MSWKLLLILFPAIINQFLNMIYSQFGDLSQQYILINLFEIGGWLLIGLLEFLRVYIENRKQSNRKIHENKAVTTASKFYKVTSSIDYWLWLIYCGNITIGLWYSFQQIVQAFISSYLFLFDIILYELVHLILVAFFCNVYLNYKIFLHHYAAFGIILLSFVILFIPFFGIFNIYYSLIFIALAIPEAIINVWEKWIMQKKNIAPLFLVFLQGIGGVIGSVILMEIAQVTICDNTFSFKWHYSCTLNEPVETWSQLGIVFNGINILYFFLILILSGLFSFTFKLINYYLLTTHLSIASLIRDDLAYVILFSDTTNQVSADKTIVLILNILLTLFGILMFNEIIIVYLCRLGVNTQKEIMNRADQDDIGILISMKEIKKELQMKEEEDLKSSI